MKDKGKVRGTFKAYLQWPLFLSVLLIILTAVVGAVSVKAGIIVSAFTLVYIGIAMWLYCSRRRGILAGLIEFSTAYDQSRQSLMEEMLMPYAVADGSGYLLWMNREFAAVLEGDKSSGKNITSMFPEITKEMLATGGELISIHSAFGDRKYRVDLKQVEVGRLNAAVQDNGLEGQGSFVTAIYLLDETQTLKYVQQITDQKLVAGLIYLDNYDEALESVEEVRRSLLTALIDRKISKDNVQLIAMEDFCQLDLRLTQDKYKGSYERCAKIVDKYSSRQGLDMTELYLRIVFSYVVGNSDMHLKNFSLIETEEGSGEYILSPAYDLCLLYTSSSPRDRQKSRMPSSA